MPLIVIPTFNRSAKLKRVLEWYRSENLQARIVVLDASDQPVHQEANLQSVASCASFASRIDAVGQNSIVKRLSTYLERVDDEIVAIGNDEDAYLPEFLDQAFAFLRDNPDYSLATGRYITSARPLLGLRRVTYWTDTFLGMNIDDDDPAMRVINFQRLNSGGVPPLYWSVRRKSAFLESCRLASRLTFSSAHELIDQIASCVLGKVSISAQPMLLRDESKVKYEGFRNRDTGRLYIGEPDLDEIERIAKEKWSHDTSVTVRAVTSWYRPRPGGESYLSRQGSRAYCRLHGVAAASGVRSLRILHRAMRWSCTSGVILSQVFAYLYYYRYMLHVGRGRRFLRMTRAIAVHSAGTASG